MKSHFQARNYWLREKGVLDFFVILKSIAPGMSTTLLWNTTVDEYMGNANWVNE